MNEICHDVEAVPKLQRYKAKALSPIQIQLKKKRDLTLNGTDSGAPIYPLFNPLPKHREN